MTVPFFVQKYAREAVSGRGSVRRFYGKEKEGYRRV